MRTILIAAAAILVAALTPSAAAGAVSAPRGVRVEAYARGIPHPSNLAFESGGGMWVSSAGNLPARSDGVWYVARRGARPRHVVTHLFYALGVTRYKGRLYVAHATPYRLDGHHRGQVTAYWSFDGRRFRHSRVVVKDLPVGLHNVDSLTPGPGGRIYAGVGSRSDAGGASGLSASVVSFLPSGHGLRAEAHGLRNPYGLAFIPGTSDLLVSDNGRDDLGAARPPDELNLVKVRGRARSYGFPGCWGQGGSRCTGTLAALARLAPHAAAGGVAVARRFGSLGRMAFVAENGSSFPSNPTGSDVVGVTLRRAGSGWSAAATTFASGFAEHDPLGAAIGPRGALYVTLWTSGRIVRFTPPR